MNTKLIEWYKLLTLSSATSQQIITKPATPQTKARPNTSETKLPIGAEVSVVETKPSKFATYAGRTWFF